MSLKKKRKVHQFEKGEQTVNLTRSLCVILSFCFDNNKRYSNYEYLCVYMSEYGKLYRKVTFAQNYIFVHSYKLF